MGAAASVDESVLLSVEDVEASAVQDHFRKKLRRNEELLRRADKSSEVVGYQAAAPYAQPLLKVKLGDPECLEDVHASFCDDQRRQKGSSEVYLEHLATGGELTAMTALDKAHIACASSEGQIWVYNWREDRVISQLRSSSVTLLDEDGNPEVCKVRRMQPLTQDHRVLGTCDERGTVCIWDLFTSSLIAESRFHEKSCTSIKADFWRQSFATTGEDSALILYDLAQEQVRERALPAPLTCGNGIPNTCLGIGGDRFPNLLAVGGADGKLRIWDQAVSLKRMHTIQVGAVTPTQCFVAPSGWQLILSASLGDSSYSGMRPDRGGLYCYDLRMLSDGHDNKNGALVVKWPSGIKDNKDLAADCGASSMRSSMKSSRSRGSAMTANKGPSSRMALGSGIGGMDLAMVEEGNSTMAVCLMDNVVKAFDIGTGEEIPMDTQRKTVRSAPTWEFDATDRIEQEYAHASVLTAIGRHVFVGTTSPSLQIWRRPVGNNFGHSDYTPPPLQPMELRMRCVPRALNAHDVPKQAVLADPTLRPGVALGNVYKALQADRHRLAMALGPQEAVEGVRA
ncbi:unnamed protein product [Effrenium voratum]|uniref:Uncharacterized protein n=1 Tax=Effrenium voratum TaxID=2562239 RepID=A0AA36MYZ4_9DINO|nr:unnamed protein product [Effrenium voratum]